MATADSTKTRNHGMLPRLWPLLALLAIVAIIALCASFAPVVLQRRATQGLINLVAVVGLYIFVGNSGVLSFGNVAFMAVGAYVSALLTMKPTAKAVFLFRGVETPLYQRTAESPSTKAGRLPVRRRDEEPQNISISEKHNAFRGRILPEGRGLTFVLSMSASVSLSWY